MVKLKEGEEARERIVYVTIKKESNILIFREFLNVYFVILNGLIRNFKATNNINQKIVLA